jgi:integrase
MKWFGSENPDDLLRGTNEEIEDKIMSYIEHASSVEKLATGSIRMKMSALRLFYSMNRRPLSWKLIDRTIEKTAPLKDRAYTKEEIRKLLSVCDIRSKALVLLLASTGIRLGALPKLIVGSLKPMDHLYLVRVYEDSPDDYYYTFCTPEARAAIDAYLSFREMAGEKILATSPLFRAEFDTQSREKFINVEPTNEQAIKKTIQRITFVSGIRVKKLINMNFSLESCSLSGRTRHEVKQVHGFRKYFNTACKNGGMTHEAKEFLMGHDCGLDENYYDDENPESVKKMMSEYLKVLDALTISEEDQLREQVTKLKVEVQDIDTIKKAYVDVKLELEKRQANEKKVEAKLEEQAQTLKELGELQDKHLLLLTMAASRAGTKEEIQQMLVDTTNKMLGRDRILALVEQLETKAA